MLKSAIETHQPAASVFDDGNLILFSRSFLFCCFSFSFSFSADFCVGAAGCVCVSPPPDVLAYAGETTLLTRDGLGGVEETATGLGFGWGGVTEAQRVAVQGGVAGGGLVECGAAA